MRGNKLSILVLITITVLLLSACGPKGPPEKVQPAYLEPIEGSEFSRVILTEKAVERIGIETVQIREEVIERTQSFGSEVVAVNGATETDPAHLLLRIQLSDRERESVDFSAPANVKSLDDFDDDDDDDDEGFMAEPDEGPDDDDPEENLNSLYYIVASPGLGLSVGQRVIVEIPLMGNRSLRKVVPYAAVIYGVHGETWVYTNPEPLVFVRQPIVIEYIDEDLVILSEGPDVNTPVVTVGGAELFGTETGVSK